ncbi:SRPBCC domain-containing protein [Sulfitobacter sp. D35]|uniref:SRPBCC family protein n=1 Tax=Sulfitobacter sp. D35 TaxID=3083252 RepID=UPI00296F3649|nr:SRPBCC domain-containing protein [Sulfitobacter sp. D35]MDW4498368.1 SRPBCC domain-containing protein [Sulfitobacter sp. D35]
MTTTLTRAVLRKTIILKATKPEVWAFLTEPERLAQWFHAPKSPLRAGEALALYGADSGDRLIWGEVRAARPHDYLEYTFTVGMMPDAVSLVKWTLEEVDGGTQLSLVHENLPQGSEGFELTRNLDKGWDGHFAQLRDAVHG